MALYVASLSALSEWAQTAEADDFWLFVILLVLAAIASFIYAYVYLIRKRIIQDTPTSKVRSAAQGYIELAGRGESFPGDIITAPLTKTTCTWYSYSIEKKKSSGKNSHWVTIEQGDSDTLFLLIDDTGQATIDPEGAVVTPTITNVWYGHSKYPPPDSAPKKQRWYSTGMGHYRYTEKRMHAGDMLYAIGLFATVGGAGSEINANDDVRELLAEWKKDSESLLKKYDANQDGQIDMNEWQQVRDSALRQVLASHAEQKTAPSVHLMSKTCDKRRPYLLSALPQSDLVRKFTLYSGALITTFFITGILSTFLINARLAG